MTGAMGMDVVGVHLLALPDALKNEIVGLGTLNYLVALHLSTLLSSTV